MCIEEEKEVHSFIYIHSINVIIDREERFLS